MAKIKKQLFSFRVKGQLQHEELFIQYNNNKFFVDIPEYMHETVLMLKPKWDDLDIVQRYGRGKKVEYSIVKTLEQPLINKCNEVFAKIKELETTVRDVIIVHFDDNVNFSSSQNTSKPIIGYKISYKYCKEASSGDLEKRYFETSLYGGERREHSVVLSYGFKGIILDDTPENRATIESLYDRSEKLISALKLMCQSEEKFKELSSSIKLLS